MTSDKKNNVTTKNKNSTTDTPNNLDNKNRNFDYSFQNKINENINSLLNSVNQYDVPADDSCLFWSVATAYLLPARNNNEGFRTRFIQLFGEEKLINLSHIQRLLQQFDLENHSNTQLLYQDQIANNLVTNVFRGRVVDYIRDNLDNLTQINSEVNRIETFRNAIRISENEININNYLKRMRQPPSWGGQIEILAIGNLLGYNMNVNNRRIFETNNPNANLQIFHINGNHYNFSLENQNSVGENTENKSAGNSLNLPPKKKGGAITIR